MKLVSICRAGALACLCIGAGASSANAATSNPRQRFVLGYLYPTKTADQQAIESLARNASVLTHLSPCWLTVDDIKGTLTAQLDPALVAYCQQAGIALVPRLAQRDFRRDLAHRFLRDRKARRRLVEQLSRWLEKSGCAGINFDFENVPRADRAHLTKFVGELKAVLGPRGLWLTMAVPAKTNDNLASDWSGAFDYAALGRACDLIVLMAYDEHWGTSKPGPVASLPFVESVLAYATRKIPRHKLLLGLPFYARDWPETGRGRAWTARDVHGLVQQTGAQVNWDEGAQSSWFHYLDKGARRTVWFEDFKSIAAKVVAADRQRVCGLAVWRLGNEDPAFWLPIAQYREGDGLRGLLAAFTAAIRNSRK